MQAESLDHNYNEPMNPLLLQIFNQYVGGTFTGAEAAAYIAKIPVSPFPTRMSMSDWRVHVPMPLLEGWSKLSDLERLTVYVMALSATHPYECATAQDEPAMN